MSFGAPRQMYPVSLKCDNPECKTPEVSPGVNITELPFEPTPGRKVFCNNCNRDFKRGMAGGPAAGGMSNAPRQTYKGSWTCSSCQANIPELPFMPKNESNLLCRDCLRAQKAAA